MSVRDDMAAALSTVDGVTCYPIRPRAPKQGDAWLKRGTSQHVAPGAWETAWQVVLLAPTDEAAQDNFIEDLRHDVADALAPYAFVDTIDLGLSSDSPAFLINIRESE
jgi:hypothetical protein